MFIGCKEGGWYEFSSAGGIGTARLDLTMPGVAIVGGGHVRPTRGRLVLWHQEAPESFYGWYNPTEFAQLPRPCPFGMRPTEDMCLPFSPVGAISESRGPGGQAIAAVLQIPPTGILFLTREADERGWRVYTVTPTTLVDESLRLYRERVNAKEG
jgi:hypothetical protein